MNDNLPTIWPAEPHTLAKHAILKAYLDAWIPILARQGAKLPNNQRGEILYVDGFAGPGRYSGGEDGSPIIALKAASDHSAKFPVPIRFLFIEYDKDRCNELKQLVNTKRAYVPQDKKIIVDDPIQGDCNAVLSDVLDGFKRRGTRFGPALIFLDQFGFSAVPMDLIRKIMEFPSCEVFSYLEYHNLNRFITDVKKHEGIDRTFGGAGWRQATTLPSDQRSKFILNAYKEALRKTGNAKYVSHFSMHDNTGKLIYWLFFSTNHIRGLEVMKKAMWRVDSTGTFRFSDSADPDQPKLFLNDVFNDTWLCDKMASTFKGRRMKCARVKEFVLTETPCYLYKSALGDLWRAGAIRSKGKFGNKPPAFNDDLEIEFTEPPKPQEPKTLFG